MRVMLLALMAFLVACETAEAPAAPDAPADAAQIEQAPVAEPLGKDETRTITLSGDLTGADHQTYRELPFAVPRGTTSITVAFAYDNANRTVIDLGMRDQHRQRGWSGGNKSTFTISEFTATPSYFPGRIEPGTWRLILGVPNIRAASTSHYEAKITFGSGPAPRPAPEEKTSLDRTLDRAPGWRRGDFHMHTAHSDGSCDDGTGKRDPCPVPRTVVAARAAQLDFIAITDHNTLSHREEMRALQAAFPTMLLIPGTEITTFWGHANAVNLSKPVEFQLGSKRQPDVDHLISDVEAQGAFLSINHPGQPSGEACMGCGWTADKTDYARIDAIEIVNGGSLRAGNVEGPTSGIAFWEEKLRRGYRIAGIGGSDNHDPTDRTGTRQAPVGRPTTVVWSDGLSARGIVDGVKAGRVFIDVAGVPGAVLDAEGRAGETVVKMGGVLELGPDEQGHVTISTREIRGGSVELSSYGLMTIEPNRDRPAAIEAMVQLSPGASFGYIRPEVRDAEGKLMLIGNPIYVVLKKAAPEQPRRRRRG